MLNLFAKKATFAARPGFSNLRAVQDGHVFPLVDSVASQWGPRVVDFLQTIAGDIGKTTATPAASVTAG